jgi:phosphoglycolate phosphatase-like HAD superfamily hydrolase
MGMLLLELWEGHIPLLPALSTSEKKLEWLADDANISELIAYVRAMKIRPEFRNVLLGLLNKDPTKRETIQQSLDHSTFMMKERTIEADKRLERLNDGLVRLAEQVANVDVRVQDLGEVHKAMAMDLSGRLSALSGKLDTSLEKVQSEVEGSFKNFTSAVQGSLEELADQVSSDLDQIPKIDETKALMERSIEGVLGALQTVTAEQQVITGYLEEELKRVKQEMGRDLDARPEDSKHVMQLLSRCHQLLSTVTARVASPLSSHSGSAYGDHSTMAAQLEEVRQENALFRHQTMHEGVRRKIQLSLALLAMRKDPHLRLLQDMVREIRANQEFLTSTTKTSTFQRKAEGLISILSENADEFPNPDSLKRLAEQLKREVEAPFKAVGDSEEEVRGAMKEVLRLVEILVSALEEITNELEGL